MKKMLKSCFFICHILSIHALVTVHPRIDASRQTKAEMTHQFKQKIMKWLPTEAKCQNNA